MIVARINDYEITEQEFWAEVQKLQETECIDEVDLNLKKRAVENLINGMLIKMEADKQNIEVLEDEVQQDLIELMMRFDKPNEFNEMLEQSSIDEEQLKQSIRSSIRIKKYLDMVIDNDFTADDKHLNDFYNDNIDLFAYPDTVRLSHILVKAEKGLAEAQRIRNNIKSAEEFHKIASSCSECPSCVQAGDLGYVEKGKLVKEFDEICFSLELNQISNPFETEHGFHIVMVTQKIPAGTLPFEDVKEPLKKRLEQVDKDLQIESHLDTLRENASIEINDDFFDEIN
ncbi:MAG: peptidylprolyl isomerase [Candidatus Cloacimonadia bacterium]|jgi:parvulin-like peptidyl-prolyl isomerase